MHSQSMSNQNNIRLPKIELVTFDGAFNKWLDFHDSFNSMVHNNQELSNIQKLHYLRSCLRGEAISVINALESSEENYLIAWDLLKGRFDNKRVIIQNHIKTLMETPTISKESAGELRKLIDLIRTHLRALKSLGEQIDSWDSLLIYLITLKLDRNTHKEWEKSVTGSEMPKFKTFLEFLEQRCQILQITAINLNSNNMNNTNAPSKPYNSSNKRQTFAVVNKSTMCVICKGPHKIYTCETFRNLDFKARADKIKSLKLCFNCFNAGHQNTDCTWTGCKKCNKKHNTLLHYDTRENTFKQETIPEINANSEGSSSKVHSAIISSQVLLSTALIDIKTKNGKMLQARVLLDNGSQSNFITERFAKLLQLPMKSVNIPVEGLNQLQTRIKCSVSAEIHSKCTDYKENVELLVIPRICNNLPSQFIDKRFLNIPQNIHLANPEFHKPNEVDALLGVELFYDLLCVAQHELPGHKAKLQKTKLGWIVSGKICAENKTLKSNQCMLSFNSLHKSITQFWEIEEMSDKTFLSEEEYQVEEHFKNNTTRDTETGRYIVRLPFNEKIKNLGESYKVAERQFLSLERKLTKNSSLKTEYVKNMR